jgi:uncharacterized protein (DUF433 family)
VKPAVDPRERPAYTLREAAGYARVPLATATGWVRGRRERSTTRRRAARPVIVPATKQPTLLSFINLVELFVLADLRKTHGVPLQRVRPALAYVERILGIERPLAHARFKTDGLDLFVEQLVPEPSGAALVNASAGGQVTVREALEARLARVEWDRRGVAVRLFPLVRSDAAVQPRSIVLDPLRGFGRPVIAQTGIRASIVAERYRAGESARDLAADYGVEVEQIEDAVRCEIPTAA